MFVMNRRRSISASNFRLTPEEAAKGKTPPANANEIAPMFCTVDDWCRLSGLSRSATYEAIKDGWLPTLKIGKSRLIDFHPAIEAVRTQYSVRQAA
jgi:predicted DNA-binding transcriptional regulator AlpA